MIHSEEYILDAVYGNFTSTTPNVQVRKIFIRRVTVPRNYLPRNPAEINIMYHQQLEIYRSGVPKVTLGECTRFAALQARAASVDSSKSDKAYLSIYCSFFETT